MEGNTVSDNRNTVVVYVEFDDIGLPANEKEWLEALVTRAVIQSLKARPLLFGVEVDVLITTSDAIRLLNNIHRNIDAVTDVLSFPMVNFIDGAPDLAVVDKDPANGLVFLGDMAICHEKAVDQACEYGHSFEREIAFLTVHGTLHLLGLDHVESGRSSSQAGSMEELQEMILDGMGLQR